MKLTFIGAAHEVTGSCTLLEVNGKYYLIDCGMEQGEDVFENIPLPVSPSFLEAVFLTHAHIDHSGLLPKLYRDGFQGQIYATSATCDLCAIMLADSAHIQESDAEWKNRKAVRSGMPEVQPLYTVDDAQRTMSLFRRCSYAERMSINDGIDLRFTDAGHLLGSASVELWLTENGETRKLVFSGDIGNRNQPIINDPVPIADADYVVMESTYGNRLHDKATDAGGAVAELAKYLQKTLDRNGTLIIPSFAVGRTQELLYAIRQIKSSGMVTGHDGFRVIVDSPLAVEATGVFLQCDKECFDEETLAVLNAGSNPIWFDGLELSVTSAESKLINGDPSPKVIISSSGMCDAGRIRHHLKHGLWKERNTVLFVGYQAEGSLGRALQNGVDTVTLFGEKIAVHAEIATLHGTSGHADRDGLLAWLQAFREKPQLVLINHGDDEACTAFRDMLTKEYGYRAEAPFSGTEYDLLTGGMSVYTEGKRVEKAKQSEGSTRSAAAYQALLEAMRELQVIAVSYKGKANKDLAKFTAQIRSLIEKWK